MTTDRLVAQGVFSGHGEMAWRMRAFDWAATPVGPVESWPDRLLTAVQICLASRFPIVMWWQRDAATMFYNDAYAPMLGPTKHPQWLGRSFKECWAELWPIIGPMIDSVFDTGQATWSEDLLLVMDRNLPREEAYFTFSYSPLPSPEGAVDGVFCAVQETTERVVAERRLATLRDLGQVNASRTPEHACEAAAAILARNDADVPFALVYLFDEARTEARLVASCGVAAAHPAAAPSVLLADTSDRPAPWPLTLSAHHRTPIVAPIPDALAPMPGGRWPEAPDNALILPLVAPANDELTGFLVAGVSPRRQLDDAYRDFFTLAAGHVATAIANARAYEEERKRAEALAELDRAKTAFFSDVSHEFRTPLTLLLAPLQDLIEQSASLLPRDAAGKLDVARRNALRLQKLVNTLLDFSRIEAGRVDASFEPVDLAALTADLASMFRSAVEHAGLAYDVRCPPLREAVYVDRDMWEKIVLNLLSNALKFTLEGRITVELRQDGETAELAVTDTGVGIAPDELPRVFERFHRVRDARARTYEGSGIGLSLAAELARIQGGDITADSAPGRGSTFRVRLPLGAAHLPPERVGAPRALARTALGAEAYVEEALRWLPPDTAAPGLGVAGPPARPPAAGPSTARVLIADDNADMREYLAGLLGRHWAVTAVPDGRSALQAARAAPPDLVLSDVMMPHLDGFDLLRELRADPRTAAVPVILLSARAGEEARIDGLHAGADDYVVKPFTAAELLAKVDSHILRTRFLGEQDRRFRTLVEALPVAVAMSSPAGRIEYANRRWLDFVGRSLEDARRWQDGDLVHADDRDALVALRAESIATGTPLDAQYRLRRHDGQYRWHHAHAEPVRDASGAIVAWLTVALDIHDRKLADERIRERVEALPIIAGELDAAGVTTYVNRRYYEYTGAPASRTVDGAWAAVMHPDDLPAFVERRALGIAAGTRFADAARLRRHDGEYRWHTIEFAPLREATGELTGWLASAADIEDIKRAEDAAERERRYLFEICAQAPVPIAVVAGQDLVFEFANPAYLDVVGRHDIVGKPVLEAMPELRGQGFDDLLRSVMATGESVVGRESLLRIERDGELRDTYWTFLYGPMRNAAGEADRVMAFCMEVTSEVTARQAIESANNELRRANEIKDDFLALVSHELRTPITTVLGNAKVLQSRGHQLDAAARAGALADLITDGERLNRIIGNLLIVARLERGQRPEVEPIELRRTVGAAVAGYRQRYGRALELHAEADAWALGEQGAVEQVLENLLSNADKYSPRAAPVEVTVRAAGGEAIVSVADRGPGVPESERAAIFTAFYRAGSAARRVQGMGIGLAVCTLLLEAQDGRIWVEDAPGGGSVFSFALPLEQAAEDATPVRA